MTNLISMFCLVGMVLPASIANIFVYPISKKLSAKISDYIVRVMAPRLFAILKLYKKFYFWGYNETKENLPDQFIVITNHQSLLDIPTMMKFMPEKALRFVAKDALSRHIPLVSEMLRSQDHCMIPRRAKPMDAMNVMTKFGKSIKDNNRVPVLFPEGTRTKDGNVGKFYSAGFRKLVESTNLPVVVCALDGGYKLRDLKNILIHMYRGCYRVKVLKCYDAPATKEDCNLILDEAKEMIQKQLDEWRMLPNDVR